MSRPFSNKNFHVRNTRNGETPSGIFLGWLSDFPRFRNEAPKNPGIVKGAQPIFLQGKMGMENGDVFPLHEFFHGIGWEFKRTEMTSHGI